MGEAVPDALAALRARFAEPLLRGVNLDGPDRIEVHRRILAAKPQLRRVFLEIYEACASLDARWLEGPGRRVEIGAGSSLLREVVPDVISTDLVPGRSLTMVADALRLPVRDGSLRTVYGIHCFHHLTDPGSFLGELCRVLHPGGGCILVEPYFGPAAAAFYRRVFAQERYDPDQPDWSSPTTAMHGANQALSHIVFFRDRALFTSTFPELEIVHTEPFRNYLRYLCSGGLNYRALFPASMQSALAGLEWLLQPLVRVLALHHVVVVRKRVGTSGVGGGRPGAEARPGSITRPSARPSERSDLEGSRGLRRPYGAGIRP